MFRELLCPSSGACKYDVVYHIGRFVLGLLYTGGKVQLGWSGVLTSLLFKDCSPERVIRGFGYTTPLYMTMFSIFIVKCS